MEQPTLDEDQTVQVAGPAQKYFNLGKSQKERFCGAIKMPIMWTVGRNYRSPSQPLLFHFHIMELGSRYLQADR